MALEGYWLSTDHKQNPGMCVRSGEGGLTDPAGPTGPAPCVGGQPPPGPSCPRGRSRAPQHVLRSQSLTGSPMGTISTIGIVTPFQNSPAWPRQRRQTLKRLKAGRPPACQALVSEHSTLKTRRATRGAGRGSERHTRSSMGLHAACYLELSLQGGCPRPPPETAHPRAEHKAASPRDRIIQNEVGRPRCPGPRKGVGAVAQSS